MDALAIRAEALRQAVITCSIGHYNGVDHRATRTLDVARFYEGYLLGTGPETEVQSAAMRAEKVA